MGGAHVGEAKRSYHTLGRQPGFFREETGGFPPGGHARQSVSSGQRGMRGIPDSRPQGRRRANGGRRCSAPAAHPHHPPSQSAGDDTGHMQPQPEAGDFGVKSVGVARVQHAGRGFLLFRR